MTYPSAIVFVNNNINKAIEYAFVRQLMIHEVIDASLIDGYINDSPVTGSFLGTTSDGYLDGYLDGYSDAPHYIDGYFTGDINNNGLIGRITLNPNYINHTHFVSKKRILVRYDYLCKDYTNYADVVLYFKNGLVSIEQNKTGVPSTTYPLAKLNINQLVKSD